MINAAIFILLEVAALNMLRNNGTMQNIWFSKGMQAVSGAIWGTTQNIKNYFSLKKTNDALAEENYRLRLKLAEIEADTGIETSLESLPEDDVAGRFRYIPANIVKISNNTKHNYMIIGKGSDDGVSKGAGVITGKGAIGVIDAVSSKYSYARSPSPRIANILIIHAQLQPVYPPPFSNRISSDLLHASVSLLSPANNSDGNNP